MVSSSYHEEVTVKETIYLVVSALLLAFTAGCSRSLSTPVVPVDTSEPQWLILATTTSTENSGLLAFILPDFEKAHNAKVDVIAVGTGQALKLGEDGNTDVVLVHARASEDAFMQAGHGSRREDVMYNDFVIVGPGNDPAGIRGMTEAAKALAQIAKAQATFVSRGDDSGTHVKEKAIWKAAGIEPSGAWYIAAGQGMGAVLTMANEQKAYTLSDRATYLARTLEGIELEILVEEDPILFNPYGVIAVNPAKGSHIKAELANTFIDWLISLPTQEKIGQFGIDRFGSPLFMPDSEAWRAAHPKHSSGLPGMVFTTPLAAADGAPALHTLSSLPVLSTAGDPPAPSVGRSKRPCPRWGAPPARSRAPARCID